MLYLLNLFFRENMDIRRIGMAFSNIWDETKDIRNGAVKDWIRDTFQKANFQRLNKKSLLTFKSSETQHSDEFCKDIPIHIFSADMMNCLSVRVFSLLQFKNVYYMIFTESRQLEL